jgi:predicted NBD/HSP70 family sugar kinase
MTTVQGRSSVPPLSIGKRTTRDIRNASRFAVLRGMYAVGTPTRQELAQLTGLSFATVSTIVNELFGIGLLAEAGREDSGGGRPRARLKLAAERGLLLGVDVAETYIHVDVFDAALHRLTREEHPIRERSDPTYVIGEIVGTIQAALANHPGAPVLGTGVSLPGQVQPEAGVSVFAPNWGWHQVPVQDLLEDRLGLPVHLDNPLKATTVAELWFGHGREVGDLVTVNLGTGVGAGIAIDGQLVRGVTNNAGEWGHTTLIMDGRACRCGRLGCVEAYIGVPGLMATFRAEHPGHPYARLKSQSRFVSSVADGLRREDPAARWLIERFAHELGAALANLVNMINPRRVVLSSWTAQAVGEWLIPPTRERMRAESIAGSADAVVLVMTAVEDSPVGLGMAALALENFLETAGVPSGGNLRG